MSYEITPEELTIINPIEAIDVNVNGTINLMGLLAADLFSWGGFCPQEYADRLARIVR